MIVQARAPGKIILSGEHAVVYGAPALVAAVARYTTVYFHPVKRSRSLRTALKGIAMGRQFPLSALNTLSEKLDARFEAFSAGKLPVNNILQRPDDLMLYTLAQIAGRLPFPGANQQGLPTPGHLHTQSELPLGAGMGSSAAIIAATMVLYEYLLDKPQTPSQRFERIRFCERLQHGKGSAIDAAAVTYGGIQWLAQRQPSAVSAQLSDWYWILSGIPESSTGECVAHVREHHANDTALWDAFSDCTRELHKTLEAQQSPEMVIKENQKLIERIGVAPQKTQHLINAIETSGGAAKISGAGSVRGDNGGIVVVWHPDYAALATLMQTTYPDLEWGKLEISPTGAAVCDKKLERARIENTL